MSSSHEHNSAAFANTDPSMTICVTAQLARPDKTEIQLHGPCGEVTNGPHPGLPLYAVAMSPLGPAVSIIDDQATADPVFRRHAHR